MHIEEAAVLAHPLWLFLKPPPAKAVQREISHVYSGMTRDVEPGLHAVIASPNPEDGLADEDGDDFAA